MSPFPRPLLLAGAVCALLVLAGCESGESDAPLIPEEPPKNSTHCAVDQDCPDAALFFCNTATARCEPACRTREDCGRARRREHALPAHAASDEAPTREQAVVAAYHDALGRLRDPAALTLCAAYFVHEARHLAESRVAATTTFDVRLADTFVTGA